MKVAPGWAQLWGRDIVCVSMAASRALLQKQLASVWWGTKDKAIWLGPAHLPPWCLNLKWVLLSQSRKIQLLKWRQIQAVNWCFWLKFASKPSPWVIIGLSPPFKNVGAQITHTPIQLNIWTPAKKIWIISRANFFWGGWCWTLQRIIEIDVAY